MIGFSVTGPPMSDFRNTSILLPALSSFALLDGRQELRTVFEMHRIVMVPIPAPDKAMPFERLDDFSGDVIFPFRFSVGG